RALALDRSRAQHTAAPARAHDEGEGGRAPLPRPRHAQLARRLAGFFRVGPGECRQHRPVVAHAAARDRIHDRARGLGPRRPAVRDPDVSRRRQRGVALLVAIVLFALATALAAAITYNKAMAARRAAATFTM